MFAIHSIYLPKIFATFLSNIFPKNITHFFQIYQIFSLYKPEKIKSTKKKHIQNNNCFKINVYLFGSTLFRIEERGRLVHEFRLI